MIIIQVKIALKSKKLNFKHLVFYWCIFYSVKNLNKNAFNSFFVCNIEKSPVN